MPLARSYVLTEDHQRRVLPCSQTHRGNTAAPADVGKPRESAPDPENLVLFGFIFFLRGGGRFCQSLTEQTSEAKPTSPAATTHPLANFLGLPSACAHAHQSHWGV